MHVAPPGLAVTRYDTACGPSTAGTTDTTADAVAATATGAATGVGSTVFDVITTEPLIPPSCNATNVPCPYATACQFADRPIDPVVHVIPSALIM